MNGVNLKGEVGDWRMQEVVGGEQNRRPFLGQGKYHRQRDDFQEE